VYARRRRDEGVEFLAERNIADALRSAEKKPPMERQRSPMPDQSGWCIACTALMSLRDNAVRCPIVTPAGNATLGAIVSWPLVLNAVRE
jgi:hypothetical protein